MPDTRVRKLALRLLTSVAALSSPGARIWAQAMIAELRHVQGEWEAFSWAIGGSGALLLRTIFSVFTKQKDDLPTPSATSGIMKTAPARKATGLLGGVAVAVSMLFFLAPSLRQGMAISINGLHALFDNGTSREHFLLKLAAEARMQNDAAGLAFAALRLQDGPVRNKLEDEVVKKDPRLTWVYAIHRNFSLQPLGAQDRIARVEAWDPHNAVPYLLDADLIFAQECRNNNFHDCGLRLVANNPRWRGVMAAAFGATEYDSYLARRLDLDRDVMRRYHLRDPLLVLDASLIPYGAESVRLYAEYILNSGKEFEAGGDLNQASEAFSSVARFSEMVRSNAQTDFERMAVAAPQLAAYRSLQAIAEKRGDTTESSLLTYDIGQLQRVLPEMKETGKSVTVFRWLAEIVQTSAFVVIVSLVLVLFWGLAKMALPISVNHAWRLLFQTVGALGTIGILFGSLALYLSYHPYAEVFKDFMEARGVSQFRNFRLIFTSFWAFPGAMERLWYSRMPAIYFWYGFIAFAVVLLAFVLERMIRKSLKFRETHKVA